MALIVNGMTKIAAAATVDGLLSMLLCGAIVVGDVRLGSDHHHDGHLKPFGSVGPYLPTDEVAGFPSTAVFFRRYVNRMRPLKMVGAAKQSNGFRRWTDEYFQSLSSADNYSVSVESGKKEDRSNPVYSMSFREFVLQYNSTDRYMVDSVPDFIRKDVLLPGPLHCPPIYNEMLVENIFWMSSGGTSSVVHTDSVDNIICSFRGNKQFILIDPDLHRNDVDLDHPEGAYSGIDVDSVDYTKYPGLASVSYHVVDLSAGDCLYIPFKWIHQVRSFGSNIAVNIWWSHQKMKHLDASQCANRFNPELTLDKVHFLGFAPPTDTDMLKEHFDDLVRKEIDVDQFISLFVQETHDEDTGYLLPLKQIFIVIDKDRDKRISPKEIAQLSDGEWKSVQRQMIRFEVLIEDAIGPDDNNDDDDDDDDGGGNIRHSRHDEL